MIEENAEELASIAEEIGPQVIRGRVCYPGADGGLEVGEVDIDEPLYELKDQEVMVIVAPLGPGEQPPIICGLSGTAYGGKECPACRTEQDEAKRVIEERLRQDREEKDRLIRDLEEWLEEQE